jgi:hypothetical protein
VEKALGLESYLGFDPQSAKMRIWHHTVTGLLAPAPHSGTEKPALQVHRLARDPDPSSVMIEKSFSEIDQN